MAVGTKYHVARFYIACLGHKLMADAVAPVNVFDAVLLHEGIAHAEMTGVVLLAGRNQMVIDQNHLIRIPYLCKAHLMELVHNERNHDIV